MRKPELFRAPESRPPKARVRCTRLTPFRSPAHTICDTNFCDVTTNIYDEIVLKIFINTIAKSHVKRLIENLWRSYET